MQRTKTVTHPTPYAGLNPFKIFGMKIMSALKLKNRGKYFQETWYKYKIPSDDVQTT